MDAVEGLFPHRHLKSINSDACEDLQVTLVDRVDIYKEGIYFTGLLPCKPSSRFHLSGVGSILLSIEIAVVELLLDPENQMERTYFTTEDALLAETASGLLDALQ